MNEKNSKKKLTLYINYRLNRLYGFINNGDIKNCYIIDYYEHLIDKLVDYVHNYGHYAMDKEKFTIIQAKIETIITNSDDEIIANSTKESLVAHYELANEIAKKFIPVSYFSD